MRNLSRTILEAPEFATESFDAETLAMIDAIEMEYNLEDRDAFEDFDFYDY